MRRICASLFALSLLATPAWAGPSETKLLPLPVYATLPNEGNTFGLMPVFLNVDTQSQHTNSIFAPSVSWNSTIRFTGTLRYYMYPSATRTLLATASASTHVNRNIHVDYTDLPMQAGKFTLEVRSKFEQSIFVRFFGLGPDTRATDETSYTRRTTFVFVRGGLNAGHHLNFGAKVEARFDSLLRHSISGLPLAQDVHPQAAGMGGAGYLAQGLSIRYETREHAEFSREGIATELNFGPAQGLYGTGAFTRAEWHTRALFMEAPRLQGSVRLYVNYVFGDRLPFYYQSMLGGENLLRGFPEDRFIDQGAWTLDLEQRILLYQAHIFEVASDWRLDPFLTVGQVFRHPSGVVDHVRVAGGLGFRVFVGPTVLGRIDVGYGGEGVKVYVVLGYPF